MDLIAQAVYSGAGWIYCKSPRRGIYFIPPHFYNRAFQAGSLRWKLLTAQYKFINFS